MAGDRIRAAIAARGEARIIVATGASQFEFLDFVGRHLIRGGDFGAKRCARW